MSDLFAAAGFSREDKIGSLRREIKMRRQVYPRWVANKKMSQDEADRELAIMEAMLADYEGRNPDRNPCERCGADISPCMDTHCDRCVKEVLMSTALEPFAKFAMPIHEGEQQTPLDRIDGPNGTGEYDLVSTVGDGRFFRLYRADFERAAEAVKWGAEDGA